jgi:hypothetical protein
MLVETEVHESRTLGSLVLKVIYDSSVKRGARTAAITVASTAVNMKPVHDSRTEQPLQESLLRTVLHAVRTK